MSTKFNTVHLTTLPLPRQFNGGPPNTTNPSPPNSPSSSLCSCAISNFITCPDNIRRTCCCNTADHDVGMPYPPSRNCSQVSTDHQGLDGCDWDVSRNSWSANSAVTPSLSKTASQGEEEMAYAGGRSRTRGASKIILLPQVGKTEKKTLAAGMLMALGVAGLFMG